MQQQYWFYFSIIFKRCSFVRKLWRNRKSIDRNTNINGRKLSKFFKLEHFEIISQKIFHRKFRNWRWTKSTVIPVLWARAIKVTLKNFFKDFWTGFTRMNSTHFGNGESVVEIDSFDSRFGFTRFEMVSTYSNTCTRKFSMKNWAYM